MKFSPDAKVFTVEIGGQPIVSFEAINTREANELVKEAWFHHDLKRLTSKSVALWDGVSAIRSRPASEQEAERYSQFAAEAAEESGDILLAFLIDLDAPMSAP